MPIAPMTIDEPPMIPPESPIIPLNPKTKGHPKTRAHAQFSGLIDKIDQQKRLLDAWNEAIAHHHEERSLIFMPLIQRFINAQEKLAQQLDRALDDDRFRQRDRDKLQGMILDLIEPLIDQGGADHLKPLYDKHSKVSYDLQMAPLGEKFEDLIAEAFHQEDFFDKTLTDREIDAIHQRLLEEEMAFERLKAERIAQRQKRQLAPKATDNQSVSQSIQSVFRQLASALHPDREQDPDEKIRKTALMQDINVAYQNRDLLKLLQWQLALEPTDQNPIQELPEQKIKDFNQILREQLKKLQNEIADIEARYREHLGLSQRQKCRPDLLLHRLRQDMAVIKKELQETERTIKAVRHHETLASWLRELPRSNRPL